MKALGGAVLMVCACAALAGAQTPTSPAKAVMQLEHDWIDAVKAGDAAKLGQVLADDWTGISYTGSKMTKESMLADVTSGGSKIETFEFAPMDVKVMGNIAVVQGGDTEKSSYKGKDTSGKWAWMDVFVNRDGKWVAVRSQSAMVK
jgi:ketosteroid isomerase-like protein